MGFNTQIKDIDVKAIEGWMQTQPNTTSVAEFTPGPGIQRLALNFDINELKKALTKGYSVDEALSEYITRGWKGLKADWLETKQTKSFSTNRNNSVPLGNI